MIILTRARQPRPSCGAIGEVLGAAGGKEWKTASQVGEIVLDKVDDSPIRHNPCKGREAHRPVHLVEEVAHVTAAANLDQRCLVCVLTAVLTAHIGVRHRLGVPVDGGLIAGEDQTGGKWWW